MPKKVVLAYSGGLDTSIIIPWLKETYAGCEVIAMIGDLGQQEDLQAARKKALATGAAPRYIEDLREEFITGYIWPTLRAGAVYEHKYLLGTSFARPLLAKRQVEIAKKLGADALAHGCTGKGNDQVRFELAAKALAPELQIIAPWREWNINSREEAIAYAQSHNIPVEQTKKNIYSRDRNIWHLSHEGGVLEDPANAPEEAMWQWIVSPANAPDQPDDSRNRLRRRHARLRERQEARAASRCSTKLNEIAAANGVGRMDIVENRLVGMKSRGAYETPGGTLLVTAHRELESLCARPRDRALPADAFAALRRDGLLRHVVHAAARSSRCILHQLAAARHRLGRRSRSSKATSTSPRANRPIRSIARILRASA